MTTPAPRARRPVIDLAAAIGGELGGQHAERAPVPAVVPAGPQEPALPAVITAAVLPDPHSPTGEGDLSAGELADLATCEAALDNLRLAFAAAGKALQVIRDARLYRVTHPTFAEYVDQRWGMKTSQAYRLIEAWPLAQALSPIGDRLTESQVRELLPLADKHGNDAAAVVYETVTEAGGGRVTATLLRDVVGILPGGHFDPAEAVAQIREYLAGQPQPAVSPTPRDADPVQAFTAVTSRLLASLQGIADGEAIKAVGRANPDLVRETIATVRATLHKIEREATTTV